MVNMKNQPTQKAGRLIKSLQISAIHLQCKDPLKIADTVNLFALSETPRKL